MTFASRCSECGFFLGTSSDDSQQISESFAVRVDTTPEYYKLLSSNDPPYESCDVELVDSVVSETEKCLERIDDRIARLRSRLAQLEHQRLSLSKHLARNKSILSPLRRLPDEILVEIFSWTLPSIVTMRRRGSFDVTQPPWILGHISSRWRAVALASPSLWSLVAVNYTGTVDDRLPMPRAMLETQLERALTLKIHFYASEKAAISPQQWMFEFLAAQSTRWEELSISLTADLLPLLNRLRGQLPVLSRLWLQWDSARSQPKAAAQSELIDTIDCFETAPALVDVGIYNEYAFVPVRLPIRQLVRYQLDGPLAVHRRLLEQAARTLVEVHIDLCFHPPFWVDSDHITIPSLRRLYIRDSIVLDYLTLPALEEVALCIWDLRTASYVANIQSLVSRSACPLRRLCVKGLLTSQSTLDLLHALPSVAELAFIAHSHYSKNGAEELIEALSDVSAAPHLSGVFLGCENKCHIDYALYAEMLRARWEADHCALHRAALLIDSNWDSDSLSGLTDETRFDLDVLRGEGLDLVLCEGVEATEVIGGWTFNSVWN
ncbi:ABC protein [Mycena sanguinolenta]|uniref:ABC protein n=1 Tax=Mycena sanguinolenta TaxID=230812 RepID=A0A8H7DH38_9AGAR|nr:ABC protein [Mycena sanguinolenta]